MTVSRDIVLAHHGEIMLTSNIGEGTEVTMSLPLKTSSS
jgi:signal transduction histidine kinase